MRLEKHKKDFHGLAATDGRHLYFNENLMNELPEESFNFVVLHELFHIILRHAYPKKLLFYEKKYWNIAADLIVNWLILDMRDELKRKKLPIQPIAETFLSMDDLSDDPSHKIAAAFLQQAKYQGILTESPPVFVKIEWRSFEAQIPNTADFIFDLLDSDGTPHGQVDSYIRDLLNSCEKYAGNYGLPYNLQGLLDELTNTHKLPWQLILRRYLEASTGRDDFEFCPPDTRMLYSKTILPSSNIDEKALRNALIVLDVSSSISKDELLIQVLQIKSILSSLEFTGSILSFGSDIYQEALLTDNSALEKYIDNLEIGGGTNWENVVKHVQKNKPNAKPIIVFTDGYFFSFDKGLEHLIFIVQDTPPIDLYTLGRVIEV